MSCYQLLYIYRRPGPGAAVDLSNCAHSLVAHGRSFISRKIINRRLFCHTFSKEVNVHHISAVPLFSSFVLELQA